MKPTTSPFVRHARTACLLAAAALVTASAAGTQPGTVAPVANPTWADVKAVKQEPDAVAKQLRILERTQAELAGQTETARQEASAATAAFVDAKHELPAEVVDTIAAAPDPTTVVKNAAATISADVNIAAASVNPVDQLTAPATAPLGSAIAATSVEETAAAVPTDTPEARFEQAAASQTKAEEQLAAAELKSAEVQAQIQYLKAGTDDPAPFLTVIDAAAQRSAKEFQDRLDAEEARKHAEEEAARVAAEAARLAAIEAARWVNPSTGGISDVYGPRDIICTEGGCSSPFHGGTDVAGGCDAPVFAAHRGTVTSAGPNGTYGNYITIDHGGGVSTAYAHLGYGGVLVTAGQQVAAGQQIGLSGSTGASTGCHLHFEVYVNGGSVDPQPFMWDRNAKIG